MVIDRGEIQKLQKLAVLLRKDCIETQCVAGSGHLGGSFSALEMMIYLYFKQMKVDCENYRQAGRDVFILSKGHASLGYYSVLARRGFFPVAELKTYRQLGSRLQGHTHMDAAPGIECSTGSLGQGLSFGLGLALGYKMKKLDGKVYVMLGDGEMQEGQIWEALQLQGRLKLHNLIILVDANKLQLDDTVENVLGLTNLAARVKAFGYHVVEIDGHDYQQIAQAFTALKCDQANIIIANTVKGKGVSFMENSVPWHAKKVDDVEYRLAMEELTRQEVLLDA